MTARRACAALVAAGALGTAAIALAHYPEGPSRPCPGETDAVLRKGPWFVVKAPPGMGRIVTHATGRLDGSFVLASDGRRVARSADGGCTWQASYDVGADDPTGGQLPHVSAVAFPAAAARGFVLLDGIAKTAGARLLRSEDGGEAWEPAGDGLPVTGSAADVVAAPGDPDRLWIDVALAGGGTLYASEDGGRTFTERSSGAQILRMAVDPLDPRSLFVVRADHSVQHSADGGASFTDVTIPPAAPPGTDPLATDPSQWRDLAVAHVAGHELTLVVAAAPGEAADVSRVVASVDGGRSFTELPNHGLGPVTGVAFGNSPAQVLLASGSASTAFRGPGLRAYDLDYHLWRDVDSAQLGSMYQPRSYTLSAARGHDGYSALELLRSAPGADPPVPDAIARYEPPDPPGDQLSLEQQVRCKDENYREPAPAATAPVAFEPEDLDVQLKPGRPSTIDLDADVAGAPPPLDVYFLADATNSQDPAIDGVLCSIKRVQQALAERHIDVWFGLGTYADRYDYRYRRVVDLQPPGQNLVEALRGVFTRRGEEEPVRSALYQTATGAGLDFVDHDRVQDDPGQTREVPVKVAPGQQASFRDGALHTTVVIGDEPYDTTTPGEPSRQQVVDALRAKGILSIGVQVRPDVYEVIEQHNGQNSPANHEIWHQQLIDFARSTGALAPPGGVDCDGDGNVDLRAGDPLVCQVGDQGVDENLSDTLVALLDGFRSRGSARIVPAGDLDVQVQGASRDDVDLTHAFDLTGTATVTCTAAQAGGVYYLGFAVKVGERTVDTLRGVAHCGKARAPAVAGSGRPSPSGPAPAPASPKASPSPVVPAPPSPPTPNPAVAIAPPPPPPAPAPVSPLPSVSASAAPAPTPQAAPAPTPGAAALAAAPSERPAPQVAAARIDGEHPLSARRAPPAGPTPATLAARAGHGRGTLPPAAFVTLGIGGAGLFGFVVLEAEARRRRREPAAAVLRADD